MFWDAATRCRGAMGVVQRMDGLTVVVVVGANRDVLDWQATSLRPLQAWLALRRGGEARYR